MRKNMLISLVSIIVAFTMIPFSGSAQVPKMINYQGYLTDTEGNPVNGSVSMTFAIYDVATGGSALWSESRTVTVDNGRYSVNLGAVNPLNLAEAKPYYLGVQVGADPEMTARKELTSAMYSLFVDGITVKDGNVGVGTATPGTLLHIRNREGAGELPMNINGLFVENDGDLNDYYVFQTATKGGGKSFTVTNTGNVGIGTTLPDTLLHIRHRNGAGLVPMNMAGLFVENDGDVNDYYVFQTATKGGGKSFTVTNAGNVGIGTTLPGTLLHIRHRNGAGLTPKNIAGLFVENDGDVNDYYVFQTATKGGGKSFTVTNAGNVGIGTTSPTHKLSVNGTIRAKEIIVDSGWADFVFDDQYELMPLSKVEQHIKTEKHLPGIPTAQEVEESGVSVGDMQAKMLQKLEELTLHLIEQDKTLSALQQENERLKERLSVLENVGN